MVVFALLLPFCSSFSPSSSSSSFFFLPAASSFLFFNFLLLLLPLLLLLLPSFLLVKSMDLGEKIKKSRNFGEFEANFG